MADQGTTGSSPWDEVLDEKDIVKKPKPSVVGDLSMTSQSPATASTSPPPTLQVPNNIEEKVGAKVNVAEAVSTPKVEEYIVEKTPVPIAQPETKIAPPTTTSQPDSVPLPEVKPVVKNVEEITPAPSAPQKENDDNFWQTIYAKQEELAKSAPKSGQMIAGVEVPIENPKVVSPPVPTLNNPAPKNLESDIIGKPSSSQTVALPTTPKVVVKNTSLPVTPPTTLQSEVVPVKISVTPEKSSDIDHLFASTPKAEIKNPQTSNKPASVVSPSEKKPTGKNKIKFIILSVITAFVVTFSLGVFLTEEGILSIGLEKIYGLVRLETLWGGLPANPAIAFVKSTEKTSAEKNFDLNGVATLTVNRGVKSETISPILSAVSLPISFFADEDLSKKIPAVLTATTSPDLTAKTTLGTVEEVKANITAGFSSDTSGAEIKLSSKKNQNSFVNLTYNNSHLYLKSSSDIIYDTNASDSWIKYDLNSYKGQNVSGDFLGSNFSSSDFSMTGKRLGNEKIQDVKCYHYSSQVVVGNSLSAFGIEGESIQGAEVEFWSGVKDHRLYQIKMTIVTNNSAISRLESTINFSNFGSAKNSYPIPAAFVSASASSQPTSTSGSSSTSTSPTSTDSTVASRDSQRKSDLSKIASALDRYFLIYDSYPKADKTEKTGIETSKIYSALVPNYLAEMPLDPDPNKYYYGYESDSSSYRLSAVLENTSDSDGRKVGSYFIYYLSSE